jgi:hypothetical protein
VLVIAAVALLASASLSSTLILAEDEKMSDELVEFLTALPVVDNVTIDPLSLPVVLLLLSSMSIIVLVLLLAFDALSRRSAGATVVVLLVTAVLLLLPTQY